MNHIPHEKSKQKNGEFIPNFTQYPNEILDNWMPHLSGNQTKIMNVFVRQIYGYHKDCDRISVRQISSKTGIPTAGVFRDLKILLSIGAIRIIKKGNKSIPYTYQIVNVTELLSEKAHNKKDKGVIAEITVCYRSDNSGVIAEITDVLSQREQQNKEINIKEKCEIKQEPPIEPELPQPEQSKPTAHTQPPKSPIDPQPAKEYSLPNTFKEIKVANLTEQSTDEEFEALAAKLFTAPKDDPQAQELALKQQEIENRYKEEIAKVKQEIVHSQELNIPKLSIELLLEASETFLGRVGVGFDTNPRRILNLIYKELPQDLAVKEDSKDVEILGEMLRKYTSSTKDERESISRRIYQAVESMLKIYVIKKYGNDYRDILYPQILNDNLILYINCNPTFKYCLGGFSNDIDGVYQEICRLVKKDANKKAEKLVEEHNKRLRHLEATRKYELAKSFTEEQKREFEQRKQKILIAFDDKEAETQLTEPIKINLTEEETARMNDLFMRMSSLDQDERIELKLLLQKSKNS